MIHGFSSEKSNVFTLIRYNNFQYRLSLSYSTSMHFHKVTKHFSIFYILIITDSKVYS